MATERTTGLPMAAETSRTDDAHAHPPWLCPTDRELVLRVMPMPADAKANGDIFGGWIMAQVDLADRAVLPMRIARGRIATVAVNEFVFKQGRLGRRPAELLRRGAASGGPRSRCASRSMPSAIPPTAGREGHRGQLLTYVAIDREGRPQGDPCGRDRSPA